jgi:hypothetical protein
MMPRAEGDVAQGAEGVAHLLDRVDDRLARRGARHDRDQRPCGFVAVSAWRAMASWARRGVERNCRWCPNVWTRLALAFLPVWGRIWNAN